MVHNPVVKEGYIYIAVLGLVTIITALTLGAYWAVIPGVLTAFITFFFRNPKRDVPEDDTLIVSPADGKVMGVTEVFDDQFLNDKGVKLPPIKVAKEK